MTWGKKKKELKPEEAIALAREQLAPFWFGSSPLLAGVEEEGAVSAHPLDESFRKKSWLMFFIDPTTLSGEAATAQAVEYHRRYRTHALGFLLVLVPRFAWLANAYPIERFLKRESIGFPAVVDQGHLLSRAFGAKAIPCFLLYHLGKMPIRCEDASSWSEGENQIQAFLRQTDPGLPLAPPTTTGSLRLDQQTIDLGRRGGAKFSAPGFAAVSPDDEPEDRESASAEVDFSKSPETSLTGGVVSLRGRWSQSADAILTADPQASLSFECRSRIVAVVARSMANVQDPGKIAVEVDGVPIHDVYRSGEVASDDSGAAVAKVQEAQLYHLLRDLPEGGARVTLKFPYANRVAVALYGIRCGSG